VGQLFLNASLSARNLTPVTVEAALAPVAAEVTRINVVNNDMAKNKTYRFLMLFLLSQP
jgi:hypothetical protein